MAKQLPTTDTTMGLFMEVGKIVRRRLDEARVPLSFAQFEALRHIAHGPLTMRELARALGVTAPSTTALVSDLAHAGFVRREGNPHDRRQIVLKATSRGRAAVEQTMRSRARIFNELLGGLSGRDHKELQHIFTKMINTIKN